MSKLDHPHSGVLAPAWRHGILLIALAGCLVLGAGASPRVFAQGAECPSLIVNGGFENGDEGWQIRTNGTYQIIAPSTSIFVYSGAFAAYLGGVNNASDSIATMPILLPSDPVFLTFWWRMNTEEIGGGDDSMDVIVTSPLGTPLQTLVTYTDQEGEMSTYHRAAFNLGAFAGQTIQLKFAVETDANFETDFLVDNVAVSPCGGQTVFLPMTRR